VNGWDHLMADISKLLDLPVRLKKMEAVMAKAKDQLDALTAKVDDVANDVRALKDAADRAGEEFSPEVQQAFDQLVSRVDELDTTAGDADGSDTGGQTPPPVDEPAGGPGAGGPVDAPGTDEGTTDGQGTGTADTGGGFSRR